MQNDEVDVPEVLTRHGVAKHRSRRRRCAGAKVRRSSNVLSKLAEVEGRVGNPNRGRQVELDRVAAGHDLRNSKRSQVLWRELMRRRQMEVPGGKPNQIMHPEHQRTTVAVNLGGLAKLGARQCVCGTATRRDPSLQEGERRLIVGLLRRAAIFEGKAWMNAVHHEERGDSRARVHRTVVRELHRGEVVVPVIMKAVETTTNSIADRAYGPFTRAVCLWMMCRAKLEFGATAVEKRRPEGGEPLTASVRNDRIG